MLDHELEQSARQGILCARIRVEHDHDHHRHASGHREGGDDFLDQNLSPSGYRNRDRTGGDLLGNNDNGAFE